MSSKIVEFFSQEGHDGHGRYLHHMLGLPNHQIEYSHDLIQWLFPTNEPSKFNSEAPVLTDEDIEVFKTNPKLQENLRWAYSRFLGFLGLTVSEDGKVVKGENFKDRYNEVWSYWNHNFLRITRAISSLRTLGLMKEAWALYEGCVEVARNEGVPITEHTFKFWAAAVAGKPFPKYGGD